MPVARSVPIDRAEIVAALDLSAGPEIAVQHRQADRETVGASYDISCDPTFGDERHVGPHAVLGAPVDRDVVFLPRDRVVDDLRRIVFVFPSPGRIRQRGGVGGAQHGIARRGRKQSVEPVAQLGQFGVQRGVFPFEAEIAADARQLRVNAAHHVVGGGDQLGFRVARTVGVVVQRERLEHDERENEVNLFYEQEELDHSMFLGRPSISSGTRSGRYFSARCPFRARRPAAGLRRCGTECWSFPTAGGRAP